MLRAQRAVRRRGFLGMLAAGFAVGWRGAAAAPAAATYALVDLGDVLRALYSNSIPVVGPEPAMFTVLRRTERFRMEAS